ncbi:hypothetical protein [Streptomyces sp. MP131-18]|uniref:hypothetical protein n=1 Tax=Streptomyces sp. MP131-18 TaxID=1857892 RepID=UPI00097BB38D|nr:hypothetical protein [Streptomyces sp. MP131-18]ONK12654.1 hypothetical protein STBA_34020 [Streptomyces sp. MP131-18]
MTGGIRPGEAKDAARGLQSAVCVERLLDALFPDAPQDPVPWDRAGRYPALERAIESDGVLRQALLADDQDRIAGAWSGLLSRRGLDLSLHHTLAVIYREQTLRLPPHTERAADLLATTTALWVLLLASATFWQLQAAPREAVAEAEDELRAVVCEELFGLHRKHGTVALDQDEPGLAETHLRVLDACRGGAAAVRDLLAGTRLTWLSPADPGRWADVSRLAGRVIDDWSHEAIRHAEEVLEDADAVAKLPPGITKDFTSAVHRLLPLAGLDVPLPRVLTAGLEWCNEWQYCIYGLPVDDASRQRQMKGAVRLARHFADDLAGVATPGQSHLRENQALSKHFMFRGFIADDPAAAEQAYRTALEWNPLNSNAEDLMKDQRTAATLKSAFDRATDALNGGRPQEALDAMRTVEHIPEAGEDVRLVRHAAHVRLAEQLLERSQYARALDELRRAAQYTSTAEEECTVLIYRALVLLKQSGAAPRRTQPQLQLSAQSQLRQALAKNPPDHIREQIYQLAPMLRYQ